MTNKEPFKIFIGYDPREAVVYHTCVQSIIENTQNHQYQFTRFI